MFSSLRSRAAGEPSVRYIIAFMCVSSSFMRWGEVVYVFVCVMSVFLLHVLLRCVLEPSPTCFLLSTPCTLACFWKKGTQEQWSATHAENGSSFKFMLP